jgi:hypothetical protein
MGFCLYYRSSEPMHPALAFEIGEDVDRLVQQFAWCNCDPVTLKQETDGFLAGESNAWFCTGDVQDDTFSSLPPAVLMTVIEVLCQLSANHDVDWVFGHDYEVGPVGRICDGIAEADLIEEIETLDSIGDLIDDIDRDECGADDNWVEFGLRDYHAASPVEDETDDDGPRLLKFPGTD